MHSELIAEGIARFAPTAADAERVSLILQRPFAGVGAVPENWRVVPRFEKPLRASAYGAIVEIEAGTNLYGTGEVAGPLERSGRSVVCWNSDCAGYDERDRSLYQSHPWVLAVRADGSAFGVLADTSWRCEIDLDGRVAFVADGEAFPVYVIEGDGPEQVLERLALLIGTMDLPPLWSLGYHQCRWSYTPDSRVREVADGFRWRQIPCDAVWMDIDYMDRYRVFTFDHVRFPHPEKLSEWLGDRGFQGVWMVDPGIAAEPGYSIYDEGKERDVWVRDAAGAVAKGPVWPPEVAFPDFTRPDVREWWSGLQGTMTYIGAAGLWNDMNEPALLTERGGTLADDCVHQGGELHAFDGDDRVLGEGPHAKYHNAYGMLMARATREGLLKERPEHRPFVLTRANLLGGQRYAATWTGDNRARWADLRWSITMALNLGLSGQPFVGPDIGGFLENPSPGLFARWMGIGTLLPFARAHADKKADSREPWSFGVEVEASCRRAIERRYRLLPYLYTLFRESSERGVPVVRPTFFADPSDPALRAEEGSFLLGSDVLVQASVDSLFETKHAMPSGEWRRFSIPDDTADRTDMNLPELWLRPGAIVPLGPVIQHTGEWDLGELTLIVSLDEHGRASGSLYEDDGDGFGYRDGEYRVTSWSARLMGDELEVKADQTAGGWPHKLRTVKVVWLRDHRSRTFTIET